VCASSASTGLCGGQRATAVPTATRAGELGDDGTNDLVVSEVLRRNELQAWFLSEHLVDAPLVHAEPVHAK